MDIFKKKTNNNETKSHNYVAYLIISLILLIFKQKLQGNRKYFNIYIICNINRRRIVTKKF